MTTWAGPFKTARGPRRKQAGQHEDTYNGWDTDRTWRGLDHQGRKVAGTGLSGEGGLSRGTGGSAAGGRKEQEMPLRGRRAVGRGRGSGRAAEKRGQRMNTSARRGQATPGDRSRVGTTRQLATAGIRSSTTVGSTVMGRGRKGGADTASRSRARRGLVRGQLVAGCPRPAHQGRSKKELLPTAWSGPSGTDSGPKHRAGAPGTERSGKETAPWTGTSRGSGPEPPD